MNFEDLGAQGSAHDCQFQGCFGCRQVGQRNVEIELRGVQVDLAGQRGSIEIFLPGDLGAGIGEDGVEPRHLGISQVITVETRDDLLLLDPVAFGHFQGLDDGAGESAPGGPGKLHDAVLGLQSANA